MNSWQLIFLQSKVNHGEYNGDLLPLHIWDWPEGTWFQERLRHLRREHRKFAEESTVYSKFSGREVTNEVPAMH
jgi:hypothetical protein